MILDNVRVEAEWIIPAYRAYERPTLTGPLSQIIQAAIDAGIARTAIRETIEFVRTRARPWIDSNVEKASEDPLTISQIGDLEIRLHAAEALLQRAARTLDDAEEVPSEATDSNSFHRGSRGESPNNQDCDSGNEQTLRTRRNAVDAGQI